MGFWKGLGKIGKAGIDGIGGATIGAGKLGLHSMTAIGSAPTRFMQKAPGKFAAAVGIGAVAGAIGADMSGEDPGEGAKKIGTAAFVASSLGAAGAIGTLGASAAATVAGGIGVAGKIGGSMLKMPKGEVGIGNLSDIKLKGGAVFAMAAVGAIGGILSAEKKFEQSRMGTNDGMMRTATPMLPMPQQDQYGGGGQKSPSNGGATGDLVFAMHNNR